MTEPNLGANAGAGAIIDAIDRLKGYFSDYEPDMKSVTYDYRTGTSEMRLKITIPDDRARRYGDVKIPIKEGYRIQETISSDFNTVDALWQQQNGYWVLDPTDLPNDDQYRVTLEGEVGSDVFNRLITLEASDDPIQEGGVDQYWIEALIKDPKTLSEIYEELRVNNVNLTVNVGVQRCFSTAIPDDVIRVFKRTMNLIDASNTGDFYDVKLAHKLREGTRDKVSVSEGEAANLIRSLASTENMEDYISIEQPYRREDITTETFKHNVLPETVAVDISTNLSLEQKAANGWLEFQKDDYTEHIREETEDLL
jgi:hypothetical protein